MKVRPQIFERLGTAELAIANTPAKAGLSLNPDRSGLWSKDAGSSSAPCSFSIFRSCRNAREFVCVTSKPCSEPSAEIAPVALTDESFRLAHAEQWQRDFQDCPPIAR